MKKYFCLIICVFFLSSCKKKKDNDPDLKAEPFMGPYRIATGCYMGHFLLKGENLWSEICIDTATNKFVEWPSGGITYQKDMGCLTVGTYSVDSFRLTFTLDSFKFKIFPCTLPESILPGEYKITNIVKRDSIIFEKGTGFNRIIYKLKRVWP